ncbi:MAG: OsmC family protein [Dehalococcoidia bacterium]
MGDEATALDDGADDLLYVARVGVVAAAEPEAHAIFGRVFEPELTHLPPGEVSPELGAGTVRVRALDQLVMALAGCLVGTLQGTLAARRVDSSGMRAVVEGQVVRREGRVRLASVHARYTLAVEPEQRAAVERALAVHERACPASRSVQGAIAITWEMDGRDR